MQSWLSILLLFGLGLGFGVFTVVISQFLGPRAVTPEKQAPYECGVPPVGDARERQSVKFYLVAMVFLLFDIEVAFLYPWAMALRDLGWTGFSRSSPSWGSCWPATSTSGARAPRLGSSRGARARMAARAGRVADGSRTAA
jgi:NADH-quinone oxidoreductase subunit A